MSEDERTEKKPKELKMAARLHWEREIERKLLRLNAIQLSNEISEWIPSNSMSLVVDEVIFVVDVVDIVVIEGHRRVIVEALRHQLQRQRILLSRSLGNWKFHSIYADLCKFMQIIVNIHINSLGNAAILNLAQLDSDLTSTKFKIHPNISI